MQVHIMGNKSNGTLGSQIWFLSISVKTFLSFPLPPSPWNNVDFAISDQTQEKEKKGPKIQHKADWYAHSSSIAKTHNHLYCSRLSF